MGNDLQRWADPAMFEAAPMPDASEGQMGARVSLLSMNADPLGAIAAMCRMYEGKPTYNLDEIEDSERERYWQDAIATHLKAPLEAVKFHFFLEAVDRSFTHQMVRQRTAVFAQESLRFAVKANLATEAIKPPSIVQGYEEVQLIWHETLEAIEHAYGALIALGIPAEDARGLLPHCVATRLNYVTDLRALADHAGNRLCTQAQFHWRYAFAGIVQAIRDYDPLPATKGARYELERMGYVDPRWQYGRIADSLLFRPVCYQLGRCPFKATFDRHCSIRERVDAFSSRGVPSVDWGKEYSEPSRLGDPLPWGKAPIIKTISGEPTIIPGPPVDVIPAIRDEEWLLNPSAAIKKG